MFQIKMAICLLSQFNVATYLLSQVDVATYRARLERLPTCWAR